MLSLVHRRELCFTRSIFCSAFTNINKNHVPKYGFFKRPTIHVERDIQLFAGKRNWSNKMFSSVTQDDISLRQCRGADVRQLIQMTRKLGWDNTEFDLNAALKLDASSIIVATDRCDISTGFLLVLNMYQNCTYSGALNVREGARGRGIGKKLITEAYKRVEGRNVCIDSVETLTDWYAKMGFVHKSWRSKIYHGIVDSYCKSIRAETNAFKILPLNENMMPDLLNYDIAVYKGISRENIMRTWFFGDRIYTVVAWYNGRVCGYGSFVKADEGEFYLKSVIGDNRDTIEEILDKLLDQIPIGAKLTFTLLADKKVSDRFTAHQSKTTFQRLFNKYPIETESDKIFYICFQFI